MNRLPGFSLIELLITLTLAAILLSYGYHSYQQSLMRAKRIEGKTALLMLAARLEDYFAYQQSYAGIGFNEDTKIKLGSPYSEHGWYRLVISQADDRGFQLAAIPEQQQGRQDKDCQTFTLNHLGEKNIAAGPAGKPLATSARCWT